MKILLVDSQPDIQQKWVTPLRNRGWGVVLARNLEDAKRMMMLHGDHVEAFVVSEKFTGFAESLGKPFIVLTERWTDREILAHQNSKKSALAYVPRSGPAEHILGFLGQGAAVKSAPVASEFGATGTEGSTRTRIQLRDATGMLSSPSIQVPKNGASVSLIAPKIKLRNRTQNAEFPGVSEPVVSPELPVSPPNEEPAAVVMESAPAEPSLIQIDEQPEPSLSVELQEEPSVEMKTLHSLEGVDLLDSGPPLEEYSPGSELPVPEEPAASEPGRVFSMSGVELTPDLEAMKAYLTMREQVVAVLTGQVRSSKERNSQLETLLKAEKARTAEFQELLARAEQKIRNYDLEKRVEMEVVQKQVEDLHQQLREKTDKARVIETRLHVMSEELNKVKERVRLDIRRIRVREKELEGQLEILKKDSGALLQARDEKILELKRRNDLLEFNMELVQEQYEKERNQTEELRGKLKEAVQVMKQANGFLEQ